MMTTHDDEVLYEVEEVQGHYYRHRQHMSTSQETFDELMTLYSNDW